MDRHETIVTGRCETFRYCHIGGKGMTSETRCEAAGVVGTNTGLPQQRPVSAGVVQTRKNQRNNLLPLGTGIAGFG